MEIFLWLLLGPVAGLVIGKANYSILQGDIVGQRYYIAGWIVAQITFAYFFTQMFSAAVYIPFTGYAFLFFLMCYPMIGKKLSEKDQEGGPK
jgi:hypothetical protein